jgi:PhnB protein
MATFNPYLNFNGNTEEAFNFYKSVFGGEFSALTRNDSIPAEYPVPESDKNKIMHIALPLGNETVLMGTDTLESMGQHLVAGNNFSITITTESEAEAEKLFKSLSVDGQVTMPLEKAFWGAYFGMLTDKFGIQWMLNYDYPQEDVNATLKQHQAIV